MRRPFRILLIEDEPADAELFRDMLGEVVEEIEVHHAEHGEDALTHLRSIPRDRRPDLIVLDLNMPVMNGHEFLAHAKTDADLKSIPVLVLSTSDHRRDIQRAYEGHAGGYILKPGSYQEYTRVLDVIHSYWAGTVQLPSIADVAAD